MWQYTYVCLYFIIIYNGIFSSISYGETWSHRRHSGYTGHHEGGRKQGSILIKQGRTITDIRSHLIDTKNVKNDLSSFVDFTYLLFWKWTPLLPTPLRFCASLVPNSFRLPPSPPPPPHTWERNRLISVFVTLCSSVITQHADRVGQGDTQQYLHNVNTTVQTVSVRHPTDDGISPSGLSVQ